LFRRHPCILREPRVQLCHNCYDARWFCFSSQLQFQLSSPKSHFKPVCSNSQPSNKNNSARESQHTSWVKGWYRPKTTSQSILDRLTGRVRPLIASSKDIKTAINQAATAAATGNLDFGTAEDVQNFNNIKKNVAKEKKANKNAPSTTQVQLRRLNSQQ